MAFEVRIEGLAEVKRKLDQLPERLGRNAMRRALRKGANVIRDQARGNARRFDDPQTSQNIAKNIVVKGMSRRKERQENVIGMRVGVQGGAKQRRRGSSQGGSGKANPGGDTWYWRFLEMGTSQMRAQPFMRPAMESRAMEAFNVTATAMDAELTKEIGKLR